jgi:hypothetical protein
MYDRALNSVILGYVLNFILLGLGYAVYDTLHPLAGSIALLCAVASLACAYVVEGFRSVMSYKPQLFCFYACIGFTVFGYLIAFFHLFQGV